MLLNFWCGQNTYCMSQCWHKSLHEPYAYYAVSFLCCFCKYSYLWPYVSMMMSVRKGQKKNSSEKSSTDCYTFMHSRTCVTLSMVLLCMYGMSTYWTNLCAWAYVYVGTAMLQWPMRLPTWAATRFLTEWLHATSVPLVVPARGA